ncbi:MAG: 23S rRNA (guanosine(2251)-2'-O)-methyltransferase RlmB [Alphaproteobacteria bacterium]|nr:23S rRNA (guanosine(2251)-2'-O)-methyltransferase RlmB [Alphaproteobacteria bacterium]
MKKRFPKSSQDSCRLWLWGTHACLAALQNPKRQCYRLFLTEGATKEFPPSPKAQIVDPVSLSRMLPESAVHQGVAMEVAPLSEPPFHELRKKEKGVLIILDQVTDPYNVGAIIRTARALGALGVIMTDRHAPPLGGVLAKAASGALDQLPLWKVTNLARTLDELKDFGFWTVGLDERGDQILSHSILPERVALIMGAEGEGLRRLTQEKCDYLVKLPTDSAFSTLNVSVATALALYELTRPC